MEIAPPSVLDRDGINNCVHLMEIALSGIGHWTGMEKLFHQMEIAPPPLRFYRDEIIMVT
jgi:hypothetical protein